MAKLAKPAVHYRESTSSSRRCGTCANMQDGGTCAIVQGKVEPNDVCDKWKAEGAAMSEPTPHLDKLVALAGMSFAEAKSRAERSVYPHAHMPEDFHGGDSDLPHASRSRDYEREVHGRLEHVTGHALRQHLLSQHPGVYPYLLEGRDLGSLHEIHQTDHERHDHIGHDRGDWSTESPDMARERAKFEEHMRRGRSMDRVFAPKGSMPGDHL